MSNNLPNHVAIIMDGNGRWSMLNQCKNRWDGHKYGINAVRDVIKGAVEKKIKTLTLFAFSKENHQRSVFEVNALINLFRECLTREIDQLIQNGVKLKFIGDINALSEDLAIMAKDVEHRTKQCNQLNLNLAINYSGRWHITEAIKSLTTNKEGSINPDHNISEAQITKVINQDFISEPDLMIRTGGEFRISNFILWQLAYTELFFDEKLWPDYDKYDFFRALQSFSKRKRRFGLEDAQEQFA